MIPMQKVYFLRLMQVWLYNVSGIYVRVHGCPFFLLVCNVSSGIGPCFLLAGGVCKFYAYRPWSKTTNTSPKPVLVQYKQHANPLLSTIILRLWLVGMTRISSHRKLALTVRNTRFVLQNLEPLKNLKNDPVLFLGLKKTMHVIESQSISWDSPS